MGDPGNGVAGEAPSPQAGAPEFVVAATEFAFEPNELRLVAGETVNLTLDNRGRLYHDLTIEDLGFVLTADAGVRTTAGLTVASPGRYRFLCAVPGHAGAGMTGSVVVA